MNGQVTNHTNIVDTFLLEAEMDQLLIELKKRGDILKKLNYKNYIKSLKKEGII